MSEHVTDEQIQALVATARPYTVALLSWGPDRFQDGADAIELEHQRRMVTLRNDGVIAVLCPVGSDTLSGVAIMTASMFLPSVSNIFRKPAVTIPPMRNGRPSGASCAATCDGE